MITLLFTFIDIDGGIVINEEATFDEARINMIEEKWLMKHDYLRPGMSYREAKDEYDDASDVDEYYYIFTHPIEINIETSIKYTTADDYTNSVSEVEP